MSRYSGTYIHNTNYKLLVTFKLQMINQKEI